MWVLRSGERGHTSLFFLCWFPPGLETRLPTLSTQPQVLVSTCLASLTESTSALSPQTSPSSLSSPSSYSSPSSPCSSYSHSSSSFSSSSSSPYSSLSIFFPLRLSLSPYPPSSPLSSPSSSSSSLLSSLFIPFLLILSPLSSLCHSSLLPSSPRCLPPPPSIPPPLPCSFVHPLDHIVAVQPGTAPSCLSAWHAPSASPAGGALSVLTFTCVSLFVFVPSVCVLCARYILCVCVYLYP